MSKLLIFVVLKCNHKTQNKTHPLNMSIASLSVAFQELKRYKGKNWLYKAFHSITLCCGNWSLITDDCFVPPVYGGMQPKLGTNMCQDAVFQSSQHVRKGLWWKVSWLRNRDYLFANFVHKMTLYAWGTDQEKNMIEGSSDSGFCCWPRKWLEQEWHRASLCLSSHKWLINILITFELLMFFGSNRVLFQYSKSENFEMIYYWGGQKKNLIYFFNILIQPIVFEIHFHQFELDCEANVRLHLRN